MSTSFTVAICDSHFGQMFILLSLLGLVLVCAAKAINLPRRPGQDRHRRGSIVETEDLCAITGYERPANASRRLRNQGIRRATAGAVARQPRRRAPRPLGIRTLQPGRARVERLPACRRRRTTAQGRSQPHRGPKRARARRSVSRTAHSVTACGYWVADTVATGVLTRSTNSNSSWANSCLPAPAGADNSIHVLESVCLSCLNCCAVVFCIGVEPDTDSA